MAASNKTDRSVDAVNLPHVGPEEYNNVWQKVRSMWSYVYDNYYEKYDWFNVGGDDLFLLVENLRYYLESDEIQTAAYGDKVKLLLPNGMTVYNRNQTHQVPLILGRRFAYLGNMDDIYAAGGPGYTLNKAALKLLVVQGLPNYLRDDLTPWEDISVSRVLRNFGVYPYDTKDEFGGERYNHYRPGDIFNYRLPADLNSDWYSQYNIDLLEGAFWLRAR
jgi:hypothetical protein